MDLSPLNKLIPSWGSPTLEGFDTSNVQDGQRIKGTNRQFVRFYKKKFVDVHATAVRTNPVTGEVKVLKTEPIEVEKEMVQVVTPGDKNTVDDFAQDYHKREYWQHYKAFRDGRSAPIGQPIEECSFVSPSIATELKYLGVQTVEQLADSADILCNQIPNGWELREFARGVCKANASNESLTQVTALKAELEKAQELARKQGEMIARLENRMNSAESTDVVSIENKNKRGRPKRIEPSEEIIRVME